MEGCRERRRVEERGRGGERREEERATQVDGTPLEAVQFIECVSEFEVTHKVEHVIVLPRLSRLLRHNNLLKIRGFSNSQ